MGIWKVFREGGVVKRIFERDETIDQFLCPCTCGALDIEKFPTFFRCLCHDCGQTFYVGWDKKAIEFIKADMENPRPPPTFIEQTTGGDSYCPEHGVLSRVLVRSADLYSHAYCPVCKKQAIPLVEGEALR